MEDLNQLRPEQESGAKKPASDDVDALLQDVKSLLGETDADIAAEAPGGAGRGRLRAHHG